MKIKPNEFLQEWSAEEFYLLLKLHAWESHSQKRYSELMAAKNRQK